MKAQKSNRPPLATRVLGRLIDDSTRQRIVNAVLNLPLDPLRPLEIVVREEQKKRKPDQNALLWAGPLRDIAEQAFFDNKQYSAEVWANFFKRELLPEDYDPELCMEGYQKWDIDPGGERVLVGSTKQLTVKGFSQYLEAIYAFGAHRGVQFSARGDA